MKTLFNPYLATVVLATVCTVSACNYTKTNNASYAADSANKTKIASSDTVQIDSIAKADSNNKKQETKADKAIVKKKELEKDAADFLVKSFEASTFEIEQAELAATHSANDEVKRFATQVIAAHKDFNYKMTDAAFNASFKLPGGVDSDHASDLKKMDKLKGKDFDKKFMDMMVNGHEAAVKDYTEAAQKLAPGDVKSYASQTLPNIQNHLIMAKNLENKLK